VNHKRRHFDDASAADSDVLRLQELLKNSVLPIAVCCDHVIVESNAALQSVLCCAQPEALVGKPIVDLVIPGQQQTLRLFLERNSERQIGTSPSCHVRISTFDDREVDVDVVQERIPAAGDSNSKLNSIIIATPIVMSETLKAIEWRQHQQRFAVFGQVAASLLHELGQPLTAAKGATELMVDQLESGQIESSQLANMQRCLEIVSEGFVQMTAQFERIWNFVRQRQPISQTCHVEQLLQAALDIVGTSARHAGVTIHQEMQPVRDVFIDPNYVQLILVSLLQRSVIQLTGIPDSGGIKIQLSAHESVVVLRISHRIHTTMNYEGGAIHPGITMCRKILQDSKATLDITEEDENCIYCISFG